MRAVVALIAAVLVYCVGTFAWTDPSDHDLKLAQARLEKGRDFLNTRLPRADTTASRLEVLDRALYFLRGAKSVAAKSKVPQVAALTKPIDADLVRALDAQAEIYFARTSVPQAKKRVQEALALDPHDVRAKELAAMIDAYERRNPYDGSQGLNGLRRLVERRNSIGVPLRDRGGLGVGGRR